MTIMSRNEHSIKYCEQIEHRWESDQIIATTDDHTLLIRQLDDASMCLVYAKTPPDQFYD